MNGASRSVLRLSDPRIAPIRTLPAGRPGQSARGKRRPAHAVLRPRRAAIRRMRTVRRRHGRRVARVNSSSGPIMSRLCSVISCSSVEWLVTPQGLGQPACGQVKLIEAKSGTDTNRVESFSQALYGNPVRGSTTGTVRRSLLHCYERAALKTGGERRRTCCSAAIATRRLGLVLSAQNDAGSMSSSPRGVGRHGASA